MKKIVFISAVSGVGKSTVCEYIKNNELLKEYEVFDIDDLENVHEYKELLRLVSWGFLRKETVLFDL